MKLFYGWQKWRSCFVWYVLVFLGVMFSVPARSAAAGPSPLQDSVNRICDHFFERIDAEAGEKKCAVAVGSLFDVDINKPAGEAAKVEKLFFRAMLRRYASHSNRPLFRFRYQGPIHEAPSGSGGDGLPPQARMLQKFGCGFLITGRVSGAGESLAIAAELVDVTSGTVVASSADIEGMSPGGEPPVEKRPGSAGPVRSASGSTAEAVRVDRQGSAGIATGSIQETSLVVSGAAPDAADASAQEPGVPAGTAGNTPANGSEPAAITPAANPAFQTTSVSLQESKDAAATPAPVPAATGQPSTTIAEPQQEDRPTPSLKSEHGVITGTNFRYEGDIRNGRQWGVGTLTLDNGDKYTGEWENGVKEGRGTYYYANGDWYKGQWKNGRMDGHGTYYYKSGSRYEGEFKDGRRHGKGVFYFTNGDRWEGVYRNGKKNGPAAYTWENGQSQAEEWSGGKQVQ